jgi:hypothetical protein
MAVIVTLLYTKWREDSLSRYTRRLATFRTFMGCRWLTDDTIDWSMAFNIIPIDFVDCTKVEQAWQALKDLYDSQQGGTKKAEELRNLLAAEMGNVVGISPPIRVYQNAYVARGFQDRGRQRAAAFQYIANLATGEKGIPIKLMHSDTPVIQPGALHKS